jgi:hypothetical protein
MLKSLMLLSAVAIAAPAMAQTTGTATATAPASTNAAQPATPATAATPAPAGGAATAATPATPAEPANPADAVKQVVDAGWATYDTDTNSNLSKAEFGNWMTALREKSPPAEQAKVKDATAWNDAAFKKADADKNAQVSRVELEAFLKG